MTARLGRRSGAAAALFTAWLALGPAAPAGAAPVITIDQPGDGQILDTSSVTVSGKVDESSALNHLTDVTLTIGDKTFKPDCTGAPCRFSWPVTLPVNGSYDLKVVATDTLLGATGTTATQTRGFGVAAPPGRPVLDPPRVNADRSVTLTWSRNTEPDMVQYLVSRKAPGGSFSRLGTVPQPASGPSVSFIDTTTSSFDGGDFAYYVQAVRKGASPSDPSSSSTATVPAPPTTTTAAPPPGSPGAGPGSTAKAGPPAGVDLHGFLSSRSQPVPLSPITVPEPPDPGFQGALPFGARPPGDDAEPGDAQAVAPAGRHSSSSSIVSSGAGRPLVPIAAGLILLVLAMHMRRLSRALKGAPGGDLPVDLQVPAEPAVAVAGPGPEPDGSSAGRVRRPRLPARRPAVLAEVAAAPEPAPAPQFYDILQEADWAPAPGPAPEAEVRPEAEAKAEPEQEDMERWAPPAGLVAEPEPEREADEPEPEPESELQAFEPEPELEPELQAFEPEPELEPEPEPELQPYDPEPEPELQAYEPEPEPEPEPVPVPEPEGYEPAGNEAEAAAEPEAPAVADPDEIEVFEVVSPTRRHLVRSGSR
jgi:hypothetical protein